MTKATLITLNKINKDWPWKFKLAVTAIRIWRRSKYFHSEVVIGDKRITSHTETGVQIMDTTNWEYFEKYADLKEVEIDEKLIPSTLEFVKSNIGKGYDWKGIFFSQFFDFGIHNKDKFFCSEIVAEALKKCGNTKIKEQSNRLAPDELYKIFN